jgi:phosphatidylserine/phosphatidylglycerophosphate/cardiolipin synthase-like enzyme
VTRATTRLLVQPDDDVAPLVNAIERARQSIAICVFRLAHRQVERALASAVRRGVQVRALVAHCTGAGGKNLARLAQKLGALGAAVSLTDDLLLRYHGKMMIVDDRTLFVLGFNFTARDIARSRSLGIATTRRHLVEEAMMLFEADFGRQPYTAGQQDFVVSPLNARGSLLGLIESAAERLLIYDTRLTDNLMQEALQRRAAAGVDVRVLGRVEKKLRRVAVRSLADDRLHVRAIVADQRRVFIGSQSLRRMELEQRREIGVILDDPRLVASVASIFRRDWKRAGADPMGRR